MGGEMYNLEGGHKIGEKAGNVVIFFAQREPAKLVLRGGGVAGLIDPFADQRGLTKPCRGGDEGQFAVQTLIQPPDQAGARDEVGGSDLGEIEFGLQYRAFHTAKYILVNEKRKKRSVLGSCGANCQYRSQN